MWKWKGRRMKEEGTNKRLPCEVRAKDDVPYVRECPYERPFGVDSVRDIPRGVTRRMYDPAGAWRLTGDPPRPGGLWETRLSITTHWIPGRWVRRTTRPKAQ